MSVKTNPLQFVRFAAAPGTAATYTLVASDGTSYQMEKRENVEACVVFNVSQFVGSSTPAISFIVQEYVNGNWINVGTTGSITATGSAVIDSSGGATSTGSATFSATSNLRLLGKGTDTRVTSAISGTVGTVAFTIDYIGYFGN